MIIHPVKKVFITQVWGVNPQNYAKFGLKGHNGVDYRAFLPNGERCFEGGKSEVFTPHDGKVIENLLDTNGYGWYVKIENDKEGSILGHFSKQSPLKVGQEMKQGDFVGYQGTSGNSTGIHLHWGYYPKPRDKSNGYSGTIDPLPLINVIIPPVDTTTLDQKRALEVLELTKTENNFGNLEGAARGGRGAIKDVESAKVQLQTLETANTKLGTELTTKTNKLLELEQTNKDLTEENVNLKKGVMPEPIFRFGNFGIYRVS